VVANGGNDLAAFFSRRLQDSFEEAKKHFLRPIETPLGGWQTKWEPAVSRGCLVETARFGIRN
jgi:hypothetical protein